jgi:endonuclease IV
MIKQILMTFCFLFVCLWAQAQKLSEEQKINKLLTYVENLAGAKFVRNGESHDAKKAAEHLRMKREKAGSKVKTALDFIEKVASKSYFSGDPYLITFANGSTRNASDVLKEELKRIEAKDR